MPVLATLALLCTLALGVALRALLAGVEPPSGVSFAHLRHAHSHLGIYGVLFPAFVVVARDAGACVRIGSIGAIVRAYALAVVVAVVALAVSGYAAVSIAASAVVLAVWLWAALVIAGAGRRVPVAPWLRAAAAALVVASCMVPMVALAPRLWPSLAQPLARTMTLTLLLCVFSPAALARIGAPIPFPRSYTAVGIAAAIALGLDPWPALRIGAVVVGAWLVYAASATNVVATTELRAPHPTAARVAFVAVGVGLMAYAVGLLPPAPVVAVAGVHALVLGPLVLAFAPHHIGPGLRAVWLALVAAMTTTLVAAPGATRVAVGLGGALFVVAAVAGVRLAASAMRSEP